MAGIGISEVMKVPTIYMGKRLGNIECDELIVKDYGKLGVTRVGIIRPKERNEDAARRNRENLMRIAQEVAMIEAEKEEAEKANQG